MATLGRKIWEKNIEKFQKKLKDFEKLFRRNFWFLEVFCEENLFPNPKDNLFDQFVVLWD